MQVQTQPKNQEIESKSEIQSQIPMQTKPIQQQIQQQMQPIQQEYQSTEQQKQQSGCKGKTFDKI